MEKKMEAPSKLDCRSVMMKLNHRLGILVCGINKHILQEGQIWKISGLGPTGQEETTVRIIRINAEVGVSDALGAWHKSLELQFAHHQTTVIVPLITFLLAERELLE